MLAVTISSYIIAASQKNCTTERISSRDYSPTSTWATSIPCNASQWPALGSDPTTTMSSCKISAPIHFITGQFYTVRIISSIPMQHKIQVTAGQFEQNHGVQGVLSSTNERNSSCAHSIGAGVESNFTYRAPLDQKVRFSAVCGNRACGVDTAIIAKAVTVKSTSAHSKIDKTTTYNTSVIATKTTVATAGDAGCISLCTEALTCDDLVVLQERTCEQLEQFCSCAGCRCPPPSTMTSPTTALISTIATDTNDVFTSTATVARTISAANTHTSTTTNSSTIATDTIPTIIPRPNITKHFPVPNRKEDLTTTTAIAATTAQVTLTTPKTIATTFTLTNSTTTTITTITTDTNTPTTSTTTTSAPSTNTTLTNTVTITTTSTITTTTTINNTTTTTTTTTTSTKLSTQKTTTSTCPNTCLHQSCDYWVTKFISCEQLEDNLGCLCHGCKCTTSVTTTPTTFTTTTITTTTITTTTTTTTTITTTTTTTTNTVNTCPNTCHGQSCDYWVAQFISCEQLETTSECECRGCACAAGMDGQLEWSEWGSCSVSCGPGIQSRGTITVKDAVGMGVMREPESGSPSRRCHLSDCAVVDACKDTTCLTSEFCFQCHENAFKSCTECHPGCSLRVMDSNRHFDCKGNTGGEDRGGVVVVQGRRLRSSATRTKIGA